MYNTVIKFSAIYNYGLELEINIWNFTKCFKNKLSCRCSCAYMMRINIEKKFNIGYLVWKCYLHRVSKPISVGESEVTNPGLGKRTTSFWWRSDSSMGRDLCNISYKEYCENFFWFILQNFVKFKSSYFCQLYFHLN